MTITAQQYYIGQALQGILATNKQDLTNGLVQAIAEKAVQIAEAVEAAEASAYADKKIAEGCLTR